MISININYKLLIKQNFFKAILYFIAVVGVIYWACSLAAMTPPRHGGGRRFDSGQAHQTHNCADS